MTQKYVYGPMHNTKHTSTQCLHTTRDVDTCTDESRRFRFQREPANASKRVETRTLPTSAVGQVVGEEPPEHNDLSK